MAVKKNSIRVPEELMAKIGAEVESLWGKHDSLSEVANAALRDWVSTRLRPTTERRLREIEERMLTLERRPAEQQPSGSVEKEDFPSVLDHRVRAELKFRNAAVSLSSLINHQWQPAEEPDNKGREAVVRDVKKKKREGHVAPEALLGFRSCGPVDVTPYHKIGYPPARFDDRYSLKDEAFREFIESFLLTRDLRPVLICHIGGKLIVLDGLARLSAVGIARREMPEAYPTIPYIFVRLGIDDRVMRQLMITANLNNGPRALTWPEFYHASTRFREWYP